MNLEAQMMNKSSNTKRRDITVQNNSVHYDVEPEIIADYTTYTPQNLSPRVPRLVEAP